MDRFDLGAHTRTISTSSAEAQRWFSLGLNWCYGFNKDEGLKCFLKALEHDADAASWPTGASLTAPAPFIISPGGNMLRRKRMPPSSAPMSTSPRRAP